MNAVLEFSRDNKVLLDTLNESKEFVKVLSFQLTSPQIAQILSDLAEKGVKVEVITLPPDSYKKEDERERISKLYEKMREKGTDLFLCDWEVGDPSLTDTSLSGSLAEGGGAKWYSLHGKFIVTEQCALACSANLTEEVQLEAFLRLKDQEAIDNFSSKFDQMKRIFVKPASTNPEVGGIIFDELDQASREIVNQGLRSGRKLVKEYLPNLSPRTPLKKGLFIAPFDGQARHYLEQLVAEAEEYVLIASERFFDDQLVDELRKKAVTTKCQIKILAGPPRGVRQNPTKARLMAAELLAAGVEFHVLNDIHAKMWVSDQWLMIGSPNLTKMNLGFYKRKEHWRANTETLFFSEDKNLIEQAKRGYDEVFAQANPVLQEMADESRNLKEARMLFELFGARSRKDARTALSRIEITMRIGSKTNLITIARMASRLSNTMKDKYVEARHVTMALIMFFLQQRRHTTSDLKERLASYVDNESISTAVHNLLQLEYVLESEGTYMINIDKIV